MKKRKKYEAAPDAIAESIAQSQIVEDFLPPPDQLVYKEDTEKITLNLSASSIAFFKHKAKELGVPYQRMIKMVVDLYVRKYRHLHKR